MSEYISRDAITEWRPNNIEIFNFRAYIDLEELLDMVDEIPAADVAPVRHGWWDVNRRCSECGYPAQLAYSEPDRWKSPYCPNCGSKMDLEGVSGKEGKGK